MTDKTHAVRSTCPYCGVGCGVLVSEQAGTFRVHGDADHPANFGRLCSKGSSLGETLGLDDRLLYPEVNGNRASWDDALDAVASRFARIIAEHGPDAVAFYVSGQLLTEDYYVANKLMKGFIGAGNIDTNSRLCMSSAVAGHKRAFGSDTVPGCYEDLEQADLIVLTGSNMAWTHPVVFQRIAAAKKSRPQMQVVVIDPRRTATCDIADLHLPLHPGSDAWLFNGLLNHLRLENGIDWAYLEQSVEKFGDALEEASRATLAVVASACRLDANLVERFYRLFVQTHKTVTVFSQGINQSSSGVDKVNAILNVHLASGRVGLPGASPFSITGQPNAMGGREVGGLANQLAAHMEFVPEHIDRVGRFWDAPGMARQAGLKAIDMFDAIRAGRIKALWIMATNPVVSLPEADRVAAALDACDFVVVSDNVRQTDTTRHADVLLPAAAWGEKEGTVTNSERRISRQRAFLPLPGEARPDWWIISEVARRMGHGAAFAYTGTAAIFREHARLSAFENNGQRDFDLGGLSDLTDAEYDALQPVQWPVPAEQRSGTARMFGRGHYFTPSAKARMVAVIPREPAQGISRSQPLVFNTGRIRDQWHTMTRTGKVPRLLAHFDEPFVELHPSDARRAGLKHGGLARISSQHGEVLARVLESTDQQPGAAFSPIHWTGQLSASGRVNAVVGAANDPVSGQPEFKHAPVAVQPYAAAWHGFVMSREPLGDLGFGYWTRIRGKAIWRHELADPAPAPDWQAMMRATFGEAVDWVELKDDAAGRYRAARVIDGALQAVCFFEREAASLPPRHWLESLFEKDSLGHAERMALLSGRPGPAMVDGGRIICACLGVGEATLREAIAKGADSVEALGIQLKAGTNCGSCVPELRRLFDGAPRPVLTA